MSTKKGNSSQDGPRAYKKRIRKGERGTPAELDTEALKINLGHLVGSLSSGGKVQAYKQIAADLSALAGLKGNAWSWNYIACIHSGSIGPSKKFLRVLALLLEEISPRAKQWFYFVRYHSVAAVYEKSIMQEMIAEHMKGLGYRPVSFTRWKQVKRNSIRR